MWEKLIVILFANLKWINKYTRKLRYKYLPLNFDIAISVKSAEGLNSGRYYEQLNKDFKKLLNEHKLNKKIRINNLSDIIVINSEEEANNFVKKKNLNLLIWGEFSVDSLKENGEDVNELNMRFTFLHPTDKQNTLGKSLNADIVTKNKIKDSWKIYDKNSFEEVKVISKNVFDISIYIVALTLKFFKYWYLSVELLEELFNNCNDPNFKNSIKFHLINNYELISLTALDNSEFNIAETYYSKFLEIDQLNYLVMSNLAVCKFNIGKIDEAEKLIEKAYKGSPNHPICQLNFAYLCIRKKDYKKAYRLYQKFFDHGTLTFRPLEVIEFLNGEYIKYKDPAFLYGSAILNYIYLDNTIGIRDFKRFLRKADKINMVEMIKRANQLIK